MAVYYGKRDPLENANTTEATPIIGQQMFDQDDFEAVQMAQQNAKPQQVLTDEDVDRATQILRKYKEGKANLDERIIQDELWWELRHWEAIRKQKKSVGDNSPETNSAWLFNSILNKHADAMDNIPAPVVLPREPMDELSAKTLSQVLPVIMEYNDYEQVYSSNWWEKLKHGSAVYSVVWNSDKENGLGDIDIKQIDLLNIYYESGITDIQESKNVFLTSLQDIDMMKTQYPEYAESFRGDAIDVKEYLYDDTVDNSDKVVVVDWYYKSMNSNGQTTLQYAKFAGGKLLYASENIPEFQERGFYDHGKYPFVIDSLFPEKGTPIGFGYIAICKDPQIYIDKLSSNILESSMMATKRRYFMSNSTAVNEDEFLDWNKPIIHVEGEISDARIKEMESNLISPVYHNVLQSKIEEMKDTSSNRDVNSGGSAGGVTAASAISALQEAGNKTSRDMISASYRAYGEIVKLVIELIRQFYDEKRSFRITGSMPDEYEFVELSNQQLMEQQMGFASDGSPLFRKPVFDLKISAQKRSPFSRMEANERAKELYGLGFFNPENAQSAMGALEMMDFEGIDKVRGYVSQGQTLLNVVQQLQMQMAQLMGALGVQPAMGSAPQQPPQDNPPKEAPSSKGSSVSAEIMASRTPKSSYAQRLAQRSNPNMNMTDNRAMPK